MSLNSLVEGIYSLSESLVVKRPDQVVLGLGYATLIAPRNGSPCIRVQPRLPGVRIGGIMLEASESGANEKAGSSSLLEWGSPAVEDPGDGRNPGALSDVFARAGGVTRDASVDAMIRLHSGNVFGDNLWLWRADHVELNEDEDANFPEISREYRQTVR